MGGPQVTIEHGQTRWSRRSFHAPSMNQHMTECHSVVVLLPFDLTSISLALGPTNHCEIRVWTLDTPRTETLVTCPSRRKRRDLGRSIQTSHIRRRSCCSNRCDLKQQYFDRRKLQRNSFCLHQMIFFSNKEKLRSNVPLTNCI